MNRMRTMMLPILFALAAAGCDGGQRGSGITSAAGNVVSVSNDAGASVAGIHVTIEDTALATDTDAHGQFSLRGRFDGPTRFQFERETDQLSARLELNVPAGGAMTLQNIRIDAASGAAQPGIAAVVFEGSVVERDCVAGRLTFASTQRAPGDTDTYVVALQSSTLRDRSGTARACTDVAVGDRIAVDGFFVTDGTIGNAELTIE